MAEPLALGVDVEVVVSLNAADADELLVVDGQGHGGAEATDFVAEDGNQGLVLEVEQVCGFAPVFVAGIFGGDG